MYPRRPGHSDGADRYWRREATQTMTQASSATTRCSQPSKSEVRAFHEGWWCPSVSVGSVILVAFVEGSWRC